MLYRLVITFLPRIKRLLIPWLQSKSHCFHCFAIYLPSSDGIGCHDISFKPTFSLSSFTFTSINNLAFRIRPSLYVSLCVLNYQAIFLMPVQACERKVQKILQEVFVHMYTFDDIYKQFIR